MDKQGIPKTYKYILKPTPEQERAMAFVSRRCRELYSAALNVRKEAWQNCGRRPRHPFAGLAGCAHAT
jgi:hypothetical protein